MSEELKPCPFCGAGETRIDETRQWSGMGYGEPISVSVIHWCSPVQGQPSRPITRIGRDRESAIAAWNRRTVSALEARLKIADDCCDRLMQACTDAGCPDGVRMDDWIRRTVSGQEADHSEWSGDFTPIADESWPERFHKAAMDYRGAYVMDAPDAFERLLKLAAPIPATEQEKP